MVYVKYCNSLNQVYVLGLLTTACLGDQTKVMEVAQVLSVSHLLSYYQHCAYVLHICVQYS